MGNTRLHTKYVYWTLSMKTGSRLHKAKSAPHKAVSVLLFISTAFINSQAQALSATNTRHTDSPGSSDNSDVSDLNTLHLTARELDKTCLCFPADHPLALHLKESQDRLSCIPSTESIASTDSPVFCLRMKGLAEAVAPYDSPPALDDNEENDQKGKGPDWLHAVSYKLFEGLETFMELRVMASNQYASFLFAAFVTGIVYYYELSFFILIPTFIVLHTLLQGLELYIRNEIPEKEQKAIIVRNLVKDLVFILHYSLNLCFTYSYAQVSGVLERLTERKDQPSPLRVMTLSYLQKMVDSFPMVQEAVEGYMDYESIEQVPQVNKLIEGILSEDDDLKELEASSS